MANHFFALDVETANLDISSICQIGIAEFEDGLLVGNWETLIDPNDHFNPTNISIHGITKKMVAGAPSYSKIFREKLRPMLEGQIVATHMTFDQSALRYACSKNELSELSCRWLDTTRVARRTWKNFSQSGYNLANLANHCHITYRPHNAFEDARAAGEVLIKAMSESDLSLDEWLEHAYKRERSYTNFTGKHARPGNPDGSYFGNVLVFTGELSLQREQAAELASEAGFEVADGVNKKTTILVVGSGQEHISPSEGSGKHRRAGELIAKGQAIHILGENDFIKMVRLSE